MSISNLIKIDTPPNQVETQAYAGTILETAESVTDKVTVSIPGIDNGRHAHGPCSWPLRGDTYPTAGDPCLVVIDDQSTPWLIAWEPQE